MGLTNVEMGGFWLTIEGLGLWFLLIFSNFPSFPNFLSFFHLHLSFLSLFSTQMINARPCLQLVTYVTTVMFSSLSSPSSLLFPLHWPFSNGSPPRLTTWRLPPLNLQEYWLPLGPWFLSSSSLSFSSPYYWQLGLFPYGCVSSSPLPPIPISLYSYRYLPCQAVIFFPYHTAYPPDYFSFF